MRDRGTKVLILDLGDAVTPAKPFGRGIMPDVAVHHTIADLIAGRHGSRQGDRARALIARPCPYAPNCVR